MASKVIETEEYKRQANGLLTQVHRQAIITFLTHYAFEGEELEVGKFDVLSLLWDPEKNIRITYIVVPDDFTVFLLSVTQGDVVFQSTKADKKETVIKKLGIGVSTRLLADGLIELVSKLGDWFDHL